MPKQSRSQEVFAMNEKLKAVLDQFAQDNGLALDTNGYRYDEDMFSVKVVLRSENEDEEQKKEFDKLDDDELVKSLNEIVKNSLFNSEISYYIPVSCDQELYLIGVYDFESIYTFDCESIKSNDYIMITPKLQRFFFLCIHYYIKQNVDL